MEHIGANMHLKNITLLLILAGVALGWGQAVCAASGTMPEAIEQAVLRNPEVLAKWHQLRSAHDDVSAAKGGYLPKVDAQAYVGHERRDYPLTGQQYFTQPGAQIQLRQMLFDGFATSSAVRRADFTKQTRYHDLMSASDSVASDTARAYLDVLRYRQFVSLARDNWAIHKELHDQISDRVKAGVGRRVDLEQAAGRLALAESNWLTEASNLHDVSARFERLVGKQPDKELAEMPKLLDKLPKESDALPLALKQNPSFLATVANLRAARAALDGQKSANYPTLELQASQARNRNQDGISGNYNRGQVQVLLSYNLFRGGSDSARVSSASEQLSSAFDLRDKACRDIRQETRIALNDVRRLAEQIRYLSQHQLSTEKARDAYRKQFDIGQRTLLDLLDTENELFQAKRSLAGAEMDHQVAQIRVLTQTHLILPVLNLKTVDATKSDDDSEGAEADDARIACGTELVQNVALDHEAAVATRPQREVAMPNLAPEPKVESSAEKEVNDLLKNWIVAWSGKEYEAYVRFYSSRFEPPKGQSLANWKTMRKTRLGKPGVINLKLDQIAVLSTGPNTAKASFVQRYSADEFADNVEKTLDLVREAGQWKILRERVTKGRSY